MEEFDRYEDHLAKMSMHPAKGAKGYLIRVQDDFMFRVYHQDKTYTDYTIMHYDLEVTITDPDAIFNSLHETLDYAP
jgi:hypothetical protein